MTGYPITSAPAAAADRVRQVLAAAGFPAARVGTSPDYGARPVVTAGYVVTEGDAQGPTRVEWEQRLTADQLEAKLDELEAALTAAGFEVQPEIRVGKDGEEEYGWTLEVWA
jgi:hypothetical protein